MCASTYLAVTGGEVLSGLLAVVLLIAALALAAAFVAGMWDLLIDTGAIFVLAPIVAIIGVIWVLIEIGVLSGW